MIRVALVEDHGLIRTAIKAALEANADIVVVAEGGTTSFGIAAAARDDIDVMLLDLTIPDATGQPARFHAGLDVLREVAGAIRVVILTGEDEASVGAEAMSIGARGFVRKGGSFVELVHAVRRVHAGEIISPPDVVAAARKT